MGSKGPRRSAQLKTLKQHLADIDRAPVQRYVAVQRERKRMPAIGNVDVDVEQLVDRRFLCDRHRCIQWSPRAQPLIDNSCCSRYEVPVTDLDREKLAKILPLVRKRLPNAHPLKADDAAPPYDVDDEYAFVMREIDGHCQFVLYENGLTTCAIHKTCLEEKIDVWAYKPLGCSLWPLALVEWEDERGEDRMLLTVYARATAGVFEASDEESGDDEKHFACLVDQDPEYQPLYLAMEGILRYALGDGFFRKLDHVARTYLERRA